MDADDPNMRMGMFLGGLLMALVPIAISVGILIWALRERQRSARERGADGSRGAA